MTGGGCFYHLKFHAMAEEPKNKFIYLFWVHVIIKLVIKLLLI